MEGERLLRFALLVEAEAEEEDFFLACTSSPLRALSLEERMASAVPFLWGRKARESRGTYQSSLLSCLSSGLALLT